MPLSDWIVGSHDDIPATTITVVANAVSEDVTLAAGQYYLVDPTGSRSLITAIAAAIQTHSELTTVTAQLSEDRLVRVTGDIAFTAAFDDDEAREMAGYTSNMSVSQTTHVADAVSSFLWVPRRLGSPDARKGTQGTWRYDGQVGQSMQGRVQAVHHNRRRKNGFRWRYVPVDRLHTSSEAGGEYFAFFDSVIAKFRNFKIYESFQNDESSTTDVALSGPLGPYVWNHTRGQIEMDYMREIANVEKTNRVDLDVVGCSEVS